MYVYKVLLVNKLSFHPISLTLVKPLLAISELDQIIMHIYEDYFMAAVTEYASKGLW
jgi:hypothetical protein